MRKGADGKGVVPLSFLSHPSWGLANGGLALGWTQPLISIHHIPITWLLGAQCCTKFLFPLISFSLHNGLGG